MISYIEQVDTEIWKIYKHGMVLIVDSRCFNISRLIMKWTEEKDSSEYELRWVWEDYVKNRKLTVLARSSNCVEMRRLMYQVLTNSGDNNQNKKQVLELLQIMKKPKLPELKLITDAIKKYLPRTQKKNTRMRTIFNFRPKPSVVQNRLWKFVGCGIRHQRGSIPKDVKSYRVQWIFKVTKMRKRKLKHLTRCIVLLRLYLLGDKEQ